MYSENKGADDLCRICAVVFDISHTQNATHMTEPQRDKMSIRTLVWKSGKTMLYAFSRMHCF